MTFDYLETVRQMPIWAEQTCSKMALDVSGRSRGRGGGGRGWRLGGGSAGGWYWYTGQVAVASDCEALLLGKLGCLRGAAPPSFAERAAGKMRKGRLSLQLPRSAADGVHLDLLSSPLLAWGETGTNPSDLLVPDLRHSHTLPPSLGPWLCSALSINGLIILWVISPTNRFPNFTAKI